MEITSSASGGDAGGGAGNKGLVGAETFVVRGSATSKISFGDTCGSAICEEVNISGENITTYVLDVPGICAET